MNNLDARIAALREAVARAPENAELHALLAESFEAIGDLAGAESSFKDALALAPADNALTLGLVRVLGEQGRDKAALAILDSHSEIGTPNAEIKIEHARRLLAAERQEEALKCYEAAVSEDPSLADAFLARRLGAAREGASPQATPPQSESRERVPVTEVAPDGGDDILELEKTGLSFADVGGLDDVKRQVRMKIIEPMRSPEVFRAFGKKAGGGILLYGPPGCGKTHLARATAGEVDAAFFAVGIHDVLDMWLGQSEKRLHAIFDQARRHRPAVLFFDEVDALGASRTDMRTAAGRHVINQFLNELDGIKQGNDDLLVLAATNAPWHLDAAFRRPGRFDRVIFVPPPDHVARVRILELLCEGRPTKNLDLEQVAKKTQGLSGADLKALVDRAVEDKLEASLSSGRAEALETRDLLRIAKRQRPSTKDWFATVRNYVLYSNDSGLYDDVRDYMGLQ